MQCYYLDQDPEAISEILAARVPALHDDDGASSGTTALTVHTSRESWERNYARSGDEVRIEACNTGSRLSP